MPANLVRDQRFDEVIITPSTKADYGIHDEPISQRAIVEQGLVEPAVLDQACTYALALFARGEEIAAKQGLILVDTKYEFGFDAETGEVMLVDEVHTPDSSRYWLARSYDARFAAGKQPENIDKEFVRLWFRERCDPYADAALPTPPMELLLELSRRYVLLYELITGLPFPFPEEADRLAQDLLSGKLGDGQGTSQHWQQLLRSDWNPLLSAEA